MARMDSQAPRHRVLRVRALVPEGRASHPLEILGEIGDWQTATPTVPVAGAPPGEVLGEATLDLSAGVHAYKLRVGGHWTLDLDNPRTRAKGLHRNNVLSIGGAPEPLLFAPAPPFVHEPEAGGLVVVAALRKGHGERLAVIWDEGGSPRQCPMRRIVDEEEHHLHRAHLPARGAPVRMRFALEDGRIIGPEDAPSEAFVWDAKRGDELPAWWKDAVVYTIFVDRFAPRPGAPWGPDPGPGRPAFGHLDGVRRALPRLADLGVTVLYLTPIIVAASCHRYDLVDPLRVDPALGGEPSFRYLLDEAHARGLRVLVDLAFSHAGRGFAPYEDVREKGLASPFAPWFCWTATSNSDKPPELRHYGRRKDAPLLDLDHPDVRALVLEAAARWAKEGVDGIRLDMAAEVPIDLAREVREVLRARCPDAVVLGELVPGHAFRWRQAGALDCATDFAFHTAAVDFLARRALQAEDAARELLSLELGRGAVPGASLRFVSTHDHPRFATIARQHGGAGRSLLGLFLLLASPGVPALLYGEELDLSAETPVAEPEDVWPDRMPLPLAPDAHQARAFAFVRAMIALRARLPALRRGDLEILFAEGGLLVLRRAFGGEVVDVAINAGDPVEIDLEDDERPGLEVLLPLGEVAAAGQTLRLGRDAAAIALRMRG
jgi:glycosidase